MEIFQFHFSFFQFVDESELNCEQPFNILINTSSMKSSFEMQKFVVYLQVIHFNQIARNCLLMLSRRCIFNSRTGEAEEENCLAKRCKENS